LTVFRRFQAETCFCKRHLIHRNQIHGVEIGAVHPKQISLTSIILLPLPTMSLGRACSKENSPVLDPSSLTLHPEKFPLLINHKVISLVVSERSEDHFPGS
jgi:hypothetical protein